MRWSPGSNERMGVSGMIMKRKDAERLFRGYMGVISLRQAMTLTNWQARRTRELAALLIDQGFWPVESSNGTTVYERRNQGHA